VWFSWPSPHTIAVQSLSQVAVSVAAVSQSSRSSGLAAWTRVRLSPQVAALQPVSLPGGLTQSSSLAWLPSSHSSPGSMTPLPQSLAVQPSPSAVQREPSGQTTPPAHSMVLLS
jgi:hypothetical protein